jgi:hypothetical protein
MDKNIKQIPSATAQFLAAVAGAQAMQDAAAAAICDGLDSLRKGNDNKTADTYVSAAARVRQLDVEAVLEPLHQLPKEPREQNAFERAAHASAVNTSKRDDGRYFHPITQRVHAVWRAGVRYGHSLPGYPDVDGTPDALYPGYVVPAQAGTPKRRIEDREQPARPLNWTEQVDALTGQQSDAIAATPAAPLIRKFVDLPLGTRFKYQNHADTYVVLETWGNGKVAMYPVLGLRALQGVYTATDTEAECRALEVEVIPDTPAGGAR